MARARLARSRGSRGGQPDAFGAVFALSGWALTFGLWRGGFLHPVPPLATGFMIVGPILAVAFYEVGCGSPRASG
ncbi:hypothetical protein [Benzoatithermus flavus]|uniref:EamA domain-containing protein n=1 Tax=Benzoatithermus flavus TaxID=3108223 RepID=A0ABU8XKZ8_9PROT